MIVRLYRVESIHCAGCESAIRQALEALEGIAHVRPDRHTNEVSVRFDETRVKPDSIAAALANAGFPVRSSRAAEAGGPPDPAEGVQRRRLEPATRRAEWEAEEAARDETGGLRYLLLVAAVAVAALAGYLGYVLYPRFDLPAVEGAGLLVLAAAAGFASFFSPCSFPLLLGLLGRQAVARTTQGERAHPAVFGGALALGAGTFLLLAGVVIALGGQALFAGVTFDSPAGIAIRSIVGGLLVVLGLVQIRVLPFSLHAVGELARPLTRWQARLRRQQPAAGFAVFGFGYVLAGFG